MINVVVVVIVVVVVVAVPPLPLHHPRVLLTMSLMMAVSSAL